MGFSLGFAWGLAACLLKRAEQSLRETCLWKMLLPQNGGPGFKRNLMEGARYFFVLERELILSKQKTFVL